MSWKIDSDVLFACITIIIVGIIASITIIGGLIIYGLYQPVEGDLECNSGNIGLSFNTKWQQQDTYNIFVGYNNQSETLVFDKIALNGIKDVNCKIHLKQPGYAWIAINKIIEEIWW